MPLGQRLGGPTTCAEPDGTQHGTAFRARQKAGQGQAQPPDDPLVRGWRSPRLLDAKCVLAVDRRALTVTYPPKAEPQVKECLRKLKETYTLAVEDIES